MRVGTAGIVLACVLPVLAGAFAPTKAAPQKGYHKDERFGYRIKPPKDWTQIPLKLDESWLIAKYLCDREYFYTEPGGGWTWEHRPELQAIAFVHSTERGTKITKEDGKTTYEFRNPYKNYKEYLKGTYRDGGYYFSAEEETTVNDVRVTQYEIKVEKLSRTGPKRIITWIYHCQGVDIAVQMDVLEGEYKKLKKTIHRTLKSFKEIPRTAAGLPTRSPGGSKVTVTDKDKEETPEERRQKRIDESRRAHAKAKENLPDEWTAKEMGRFLVINHVDAKYAKRVVAQAEGVMTWLDKNMDYVGPDEVVREPIIRICKNWDEERAFRDDSWWNFGGEIVTHRQNDDGAASFEQQYVKRRVYQIWFHDRDQELYFALPAWLSQGLSDAFENARIKGKKVEFRRDDWARDGLRMAVREGRATSPRELLMLTQGEFHGDEWSTRWKESAALVHYFISGEAEKNKRTKGVLEAYLTNLRAVVTQIKNEEKGKGDEDQPEPETEEEEEEYFRKKRNSWKEREKRVVEETFARTFGDWTDRDWEAFEKAYFKSIK